MSGGYNWGSATVRSGFRSHGNIKQKETRVISLLYQLQGTEPVERGINKEMLLVSYISFTAGLFGSTALYIPP